MATSTDSSTPTEPPTDPRPRPVRSGGGRSSAHTAAARRNAAGGGRARRHRWRPARDALWRLLDQHLTDRARVAIVGAGNGDDLPLRRIARRASHVDLIDLDAAALRRARHRVRFARHVHAVVKDVTADAADAIIHTADRASVTVTLPPPTPLSTEPYDVVIADLIATQLLFPALADSGRPGAQIDQVLLTHGQALTNAVTARLHASAPHGVVIHLHDLLVWTDHQAQPFALDTVLQLAATDLAAALTLAHRGDPPYGCNPREGSRATGAELTHSTFWRWPFAPGTNYLVNATVARTRPSHPRDHHASVPNGAPKRPILR
jgi:SAM-dependent methyltransferase